jgi:hypothetical protein
VADAHLGLAQLLRRRSGDLDCDTVYSTFMRGGHIDAQNNVSGGAGLFTKLEIE